MNREELKQTIEEMFGDVPEVESINGILHALDEGGWRGIPNNDVIREVCEELCQEGKLQRAGRQGYEATLEYMEQLNHDVPG